MKIYKAIMDRPLGYVHHGQAYPLNYGFIEGLIAGDGEEQDVYVLSKLPENQKPLTSFTGKLIAVIHRKDDVEDKWVLTSEGETFTKDEIAASVHFQEQYFDSEIELVD
ncbi:inorganic diphosphatase [Lactococcus kimchii]|uniref:inorganic diphosphatase n=1 Tax=Lactococcus sp. S-13 TaxID=2507158 RepID=UPI0010238E75|nr:inorganic diphosphatase [Lactococcus sp. S-13]RZI48695.1 inorganic pyrophosphatase [Lactococcus sp. S-13]